MAVSRLLRVCVLAAIMPLGAQGQTRDLARVHACLELIEQRTAALVVHDWRRIEYFAKRYMDICSSVFGLQELLTDSGSPAHQPSAR